MIRTTTDHRKDNLMAKFLQILAWAAALIPAPALAAEFEVAGTYELVSSSTKFLDTGETVSTRIRRASSRMVPMAACWS